jgi:hypothetical protein
MQQWLSLRMVADNSQQRPYSDAVPLAGVKYPLKSTTVV